MWIIFRGWKHTHTMMRDIIDEENPLYTKVLKGTLPKSYVSSLLKELHILLSWQEMTMRIIQAQGESKFNLVSEVIFYFKYQIH